LRPRSCSIACGRSDHFRGFAGEEEREVDIFFGLLADDPSLSKGSRGSNAAGGHRMKTTGLLRQFSPAAVMLAAEICLACMASLALSTPAAAQFWDYPFWGRRPAAPQRQMPPWGGGGWQSGPERPVDASRAPPPRKQEGAPAKTVVVMGDSMADWLGFGLEDAFAETPEIGVSRKFRTYSSLIRGESRKEFDWPQGAKEMLATEKPDFIIMMIGMGDRQAIRERPPRVAPKPQQPPPPQTKLEGGQPIQLNPAGQQQPDAQEAAQGTEPQKSGEPQKPVAAEPLGPMMTYEFRSEKWGEAYGRRIDETIAVLKSKGVPVLWVGLPPIRGPRASSDVAYLNELYRGHAEKAGIIYVDVWDAFVDESGNFAARGPDFEGQIRVLRTGDGVHFTKAGARKLAHYVEREIRHVMLSRGAPVALPAPEEPQPDTSRPGTPAARPVAGPVVPLTTGTNAPEGLLGASAQRPGVADPSANRVLVKGEPLLSITGRADDFAWPRSDSSIKPEPEPTPPAPAPAAKPGTASQSPAAKPAAPAPAKKPVRGAAAAGEESRRPLTLGDDQPRGRRAPADNALRPPGMVPNAPTHGGW
jgi:uncharacterized protein